MSKAEELNISGIFPQLLQVEQHSAHQEELVPTYAAMGAKHVSKPCYYCNKPGHLKAQCRQKVQDEGTRMRTVAF